MAGEYVTLGRLVERVECYDSMPVPIGQGLKKSILLTFVVSAFFVPISLLIPPLIGRIGYVSSDGFFPWFAADALNFLLCLARKGAVYLLWPNVASLVLALLVVLLSRGMTKPVHESVHWLGVVAAFPSGASVISVAVLLGVIVAVCVLVLLLWLSVIALGLKLLGWLLDS